MGYSGQNPYTLGSNPWVEKFKRDKKNAERAEEQRAMQDERRKAQKKDNDAGNLIDFDDIITQTEDAEWQKTLDQRENLGEQDRLLDV